MENLNSMTMEQRLETHKKDIMSIRLPAYQLHNQKHVGKGKGTFIERDLFESKAFLQLRGVAPQMLIYFLGKREFKQTNKTRICVNEDQLTLSYVELAKLGITQPRATRGFDELLAKGFITIKHHGGGCQKDQSVYALSDKWLLWRKGTVFEQRPQVLKRGFQNAHKRKSQHTKP